MKNILKLTAILLILAGSVSCGREDDIPDNIPSCIKSRIQNIKSENVWNPPATIWQYKYNGKIVYYIPPRCCDIPGAIIDENCNAVCYDGGLIPSDDCEDFFENRTDEKLIWKDNRTYP
jgi:hypothetical protein